MFRPRFRNPQEELKYNRFRMRAAVFILAMVFLMMIRQTIHEKRLSGKEKQSALAESASDYVQRGRIEKHHEKCFDYNYRMASRSHSEYFDREGYRKCLKIGPREWLEERRARKAAEKKYMMNIRKLLK